MDTREKALVDKLINVGSQLSNIAFNYGQRADSVCLEVPSLDDWRNTVQMLRKLQMEWDNTYSQLLDYRRSEILPKKG